MGFGVSAVTTHELAVAFPSREVVGLELDAHRVAQAREEFPSLRVEQGGLERVPSLSASVVRLANIGRALTKDAVAGLNREASRVLVDGGVCLEGSTDVEGHLSAFFVSRRRGDALLREALVLHTDFARGFGPWMFRDVLPRELRRDVREGTPVHALLSDWAKVWEPVRALGPEAAFVASVTALAAQRSDVDARVVGEGALWWLLEGTVGD